MELLINIAAGLVIGGFSGLFASLRNPITWAISLSILVAGFPLLATLNWKLPEMGILYMFSFGVGFFGTMTALDKLISQTGHSERGKISDYIVWHGFAAKSKDEKEQDQKNE